RGGATGQGPRQNRSQRRREPGQRPPDRRDRRGLHFRRGAHAFGPRRGHCFGLRTMNLHLESRRTSTIDAQILTALRSAGDSVSGADLAQQLCVSRAAVWARIEELRALGYDIQASPHAGYRLVRAPDVLHADDLLSRLGTTKCIGRDIRVFQETTSTNDIIEKLARDGVKEGVVVFAESQTKGRGRLGRQWMSPARKGLWFSVLLRPRLPPQAATRLTIASATALVRAIHGR